jgi:hypothetical protein
MEAVLNDMAVVLDSQPEPVFLVLDIRGLALSLDDATIAATAAARRQGALMHHPNVRESLIISRDGFVKLGASGLRTATFGNVKVRVFDTQEQAIEYCRERIAETAGGPTGPAFG